MVDGSQRVEFEDVVVVRRTGLGARLTAGRPKHRHAGATYCTARVVLGGYVFVTSRYNWSTSAGFVR